MNHRLLLRLEGLIVAVGAGVGYALLGESWWLFAILLLIPDAFMIGYLWGPRTGAFVYNVGHTYALPFLLGAISLWLGGSLLAGLALIWIAHIGLDRALGYGLKHPDGFRTTHLSPSRETRAPHPKHIPSHRRAVHGPHRRRAPPRPSR